jgi:hypothetical protein
VIKITAQFNRPRLLSNCSGCYLPGGLPNLKGRQTAAFFLLLAPHLAQQLARLILEIDIGELLSATSVTIVKQELVGYGTHTKATGINSLI